MINMIHDDIENKAHTVFISTTTSEWALTLVHMLAKRSGHMIKKGRNISMTRKLYFSESLIWSRYKVFLYTQHYSKTNYQTIELLWLEPLRNPLPQARSSISIHFNFWGGIKIHIYNKNIMSANWTTCDNQRKIQWKREKKVIKRIIKKIIIIDGTAAKPKFKNENLHRQKIERRQCQKNQKPWWHITMHRNVIVSFGYRIKTHNGEKHTRQ